MSYYLNFDGVDDRVNTPLNITFDTIEIDFSSIPETWHTYISVGTNKNVNRNGNNNGVMLGSDISAAYVNGSPVTSNTDFLPTDTRVVFKVVYSAPFTNSSAGVSFMTNTASQWVQGKVWSIKFYNAGALVVHYDLTAGNGRDHTGNGRHAVITGATFLTEGSAPTTIVSDSLAYYYNAKQGATLSQWDDLSGGGRHLTMTEITSIDPDKGYYFNTALTRGISPAGNLVPAQATFTYEAAVTIPDLANTGWITLGYIGGTDSKGVSIGSTEILRVYDGGASKVSTYTIPLNTTVIITVRRNSATSVSLFVNGAFHSNVTTDLDVTGVTGRLIVGTDDGSGDLLGHIAFIRQYTRELTNAEIADNYTLGTAVALPAGGGPVVYPVTASASAVSSATASATLITGVTGSASSVSAATASASRKTAATASASAVSSAAATAVYKAFVTGAAQAVSSATANTDTGGQIHEITAQAVAVSSAIASAIKKSFLTASAGAISSATAAAYTVYRVTGAALSTSLAQLIEGDPVIADMILRAQRELYGTLRAERSMYIEMRGDIMTARNQNIELYAGESKLYGFNAYDEEGTALVLTGGSVEWVLTRRGVEVATKALPTLVNSFTLSLAPADTEALPIGIYQYTATFTDALGNVSVLCEGDLTIKRRG